MPEEKSTGTVEIAANATPIEILTEVVRAMLSEGTSIAGIAMLRSMMADEELSPEIVLSHIHSQGMTLKISIAMGSPQHTADDGTIFPAVSLGGAEEEITVQPGIFDTAGLH